MLIFFSPFSRSSWLVFVVVVVLFCICFVGFFVVVCFVGFFFGLFAFSCNQLLLICFAFVVSAGCRFFFLCFFFLTWLVFVVAVVLFSLTL